MEEYLINSTLTYRVPTVNDALNLRKKLEAISVGELTTFSYKTKQIKIKGEVVEEYQVVKATIAFTSEKEPDATVVASFE